MPIQARPFQFWGSVAATVSGAVICSGRVPSGLRGVILCLGGLVVPEHISYSLRVNGVDVPGMDRIEGFAVGAVRTERFAMLPLEVLVVNHSVTKGTVPAQVELRSGNEFSLYGIHTNGTGVLGMKGAIRGYFCPIPHFKSGGVHGNEG